MNIVYNRNYVDESDGYSPWSYNEAFGTFPSVIKSSLIPKKKEILLTVSVQVVYEIIKLQYE